MGTLAAGTLRYCPFVFYGSPEEPANFSFRVLAAQVRDVKRVVKVISLPAGLHLECAGTPWIWSALKTV